MLTYLELQNYRHFKRYRLSALARVNLLVGKNNSGKTSILEAVDLLNGAGDPRHLTRISRARGEIASAATSDDLRAGESVPNVFRYYHGHGVEESPSFSFESNESRSSYKLINIDDVNEEFRSTMLGEVARTRRMTYGAEPPSVRLAYALEVDNVPGSSVLFPVLEDGSMLTEAPLVTRPVRQPRDENGVVQCISLESLEPRAMSQMWNEVLTEGREETVIAAMRILEPSLNTIVFLAGDRAFRFGRGGIHRVRE